MGIPFMIFLAAVGVIVVFIIVSYNRLVSLTQRSQTAWSDVDVQLKRRTDLFKPHAYFELDRPEERQVPKVSFGG